MAKTQASDGALHKIAFVSAIISTFGWVLYILASTGGPNLSEIATPAGRLAALAETSTTMVVYGWAGVFGGVFSIAYMFGVAYRLKDVGPQIWIALIIGIFGILLTTLGYLANALSAAHILLPAALSAGAEQALMHEIAINAALDAFEAPWFFGSFLAYGLALGWMAYAALRARVGPKWLNIVGLIGAMAGIIWLRHFIGFLMPLQMIGSLLNIVAVSVWAIGISWWLMREAGNRKT